MPGTESLSDEHTTDIEFVVLVGSFFWKIRPSFGKWVLVRVWKMSSSSGKWVPVFGENEFQCLGKMSSSVWEMSSSSGKWVSVLENEFQCLEKWVPVFGENEFQFWKMSSSVWGKRVPVLENEFQCYFGYRANIFWTNL